ncbi:hypothetical protein GCM10028818_46320 [Spirosoma horti]
MIIAVQNNRALTHSLFTVGRAIEQVSSKNLFNQETFNWRAFPALRDQLIHHYWDIDKTLFWEAITVDIPANKE